MVPLALCLLTNAQAEKLIFSVDIIRHGDRTPIIEVPYSPHQWVEGLGELTKTGKQQEVRLGTALRQTYINQNHLLPAFYDPKRIYVQSTDFNRTKASAKALLEGLYPPSSRLQFSQKTIPIHVVAQKKVTTIVKTNDDYFWRKQTRPIQNDIKRWSKVTGLALQNRWQFFHLADNLAVRHIHHVPLPSGISNRDAQEISALNNKLFVQSFKQKEKTNAIGNPFLSVALRYLNQAAQNKSDLKYALFSGHDSTLMSVMNMLNVPLNYLPPYASRLNIALIEKEQQYYVKVSFNNKIVKLPFCHADLCKLATFNQWIMNNQHH